MVIEKMPPGESILTQLYSLPKVFSYPPLTLALSPRWGERG
jgi:hypothetical protein